MHALPFASLPRGRLRRGSPAVAAIGGAVWGLCVAIGPRATGSAAEPPGAGSVYTRRQPEPSAAASAGAEPAGPSPTAPAPAATSAAGGATEASGSGPSPQAERIMLGALAALGQVDSFSAGLRQKVRIGDRVLVGAGRYLQSGAGEDQRFRFESRLQCDTEAFEVTEVCDGVFCWNCRRQGSEPPVVQRLDVRRMRGRLAQVAPGAPADAAVRLGGLQRTLWLVREWFHFASAAVTETADGPVWSLEGRWIPERLASILPDLAAAHRADGVLPEELPDGVPWAVRVTVGRRDLLPRTVEWLAIPGRRPVAATPPEPIAVLELHDVTVNGPVDAAAFLYRPAADGLMDVTEQRLEELKPERP